MLIPKQFQENKQLQLFLFLVIAVCIYYVGKSIVVVTPFYQAIEVVYANLLVATLNVVANNYTVDAVNSIIRNNQLVFSFDLILVIKYFVLSFLVLFTFARKLKRTFYIYVLAVVAYFLLTNARILIETYLPLEFQSSAVQFIIGLRYLLMFNLIRYKTSLHELTRNIYDKINKKISTTFYFSLNILLSINSLLPAITGLFDWFLVGKWNLFVIYLTKAILTISNLIFWIIGYEQAYVQAKFIYLENYWLFLDQNCLGVGLMFVFTGLILSIRSPFVNRISYILSGLFLIIVMNAIRIVVILLYIFTNQTPANQIEDYHNKSNNIFYVVVFAIIYFYINWFQHIQFRKRNLSK
ncbi:MAG: exosortase/archaeosortase family protein [Paludibacter sp.]